MKSIKMAAPTKKRRKVYHRCICNDKDFQHDPVTKVCRVKDCGCVRFCCSGHGKTCKADDFFTIKTVASLIPHEFKPFTISENQVVEVCRNCGFIARQGMKPCRGKVKVKPRVEVPELIIRKLDGQNERRKMYEDREL